jgi:hypothetical protein
MVDKIPKYLEDALKKYCAEYPKCNGCVFQTYGGCIDTFNAVLFQSSKEQEPQK